MRLGMGEISGRTGTCCSGGPDVEVWKLPSETGEVVSSQEGSERGDAHRGRPWQARDRTGSREVFGAKRVVEGQAVTSGAHVRARLSASVDTAREAVK